MFFWVIKPTKRLPETALSINWVDEDAVTRRGATIPGKITKSCNGRIGTISGNSSSDGGVLFGSSLMAWKSREIYQPAMTTTDSTSLPDSEGSSPGSFGNSITRN